MTEVNYGLKVIDRAIHDLGTDIEYMTENLERAKESVRHAEQAIEKNKLRLLELEATKKRLQ